jgi:PAS domain S-box-containing protein
MQTCLSAALAVAQLGTFEWNTRTQIVTLDARSREIFGFAESDETPVEEVFGRVHPADADRVRREVTAAIQSRSRLETRYRIQLPGGGVRTIGRVSEAITGDDGEVEVVIGVIRDLTEHEATAASLKRMQALTERQERQERHYDTVLSNIPDLVYVFDLNHCFTYANKVLLEMWGKTWDEAIGKNCLELGYEPWHAEMHDREIERVRATKQPIRGEVPFNGTFGRRVYDYIFFPIIGADGEVEAVAGTTRDVTERKEAELHAQFLAEVSEDLVRVSTPREIVRTVGERLKEFLGISMCAFVEINESADTATINYEWHEDDVPSLAGIYPLPRFVTREFLHMAMSGRPIVIRDVNMDSRIADTAAWASLKIAAHVNIPLIRNACWRFSLCVYHRAPYYWTDTQVTLMQELSSRIWSRLERAFAEQDREAVLEREQAARVQAEEANRLKDEFLATVSHELRTPLNAILGWSHMLKSGGLDAEVAGRAIETIHRNARSQAQLIEDILDVSRIITGKLRIETSAISLVPIVYTVIESLRPAIDSKSISLQLELGSEAHQVLADPDRMQQVVWNLVSNAIKFTPENGQITISLEACETEAVIVVADTGIGIEEEFLPFVFDRFRQADGSTSRTHSGLGLGLSIVRHIMELHGGTVAVASEGIGKGSTFTVRLPCSAAPHAKPEAEDE